MTKAPAEAGTHAAEVHSTVDLQADPSGLGYLMWRSSPNRRRRELLQQLQVAETEAEREVILAELDQHAWMVERGLI
jgi:hypothetical protein